MLSDLLASLVNIQLDQLDRINKDRNHIASEYATSLKGLRLPIQLPFVPSGMTKPNWHIYALKFPNTGMRKKFMTAMREKHVEVSTHYVPLHISPMGRKFLKKGQKLPVTDEVGRTLVRMPIYAGMTERELEYVVSTAKKALQRL